MAIVVDLQTLQEGHQKFQQAHEQIETAVGQITNALGEIQGAFQGQGAAAFQDLMGRWNGDASRMQQALEEITFALKQTMEKFAELDSSVANVFNS